MAADKDIYKCAIAHYGEDMQQNIAVEEMAELTKEIIKHKRGADNKYNLLEEIADVYIMLEQLRIIYDISLIDMLEMRQYKIDRLFNRLQQEHERVF